MLNADKNNSFKIHEILEVIVASSSLFGYIVHGNIVLLASHD